MAFSSRMRPLSPSSPRFLSSRPFTADGCWPIWAAISAIFSSTSASVASTSPASATASRISARRTCLSASVSIWLRFSSDSSSSRICGIFMPGCANWRIWRWIMSSASARTRPWGRSKELSSASLFSANSAAWERRWLPSCSPSLNWMSALSRSRLSKPSSPASSSLSSGSVCVLISPTTSVTFASLPFHSSARAPSGTVSVSSCEAPLVRPMTCGASHTDRGMPYCSAPAWTG